MRYWNLRLLHMDKGNIPQSILEQVQAQTNVQTDYKETKDQIIELFRTARAALKRVQGEAEEIREQEMMDRAEKYIEEGKLPAGKALKILIEQEKSAREYGTIQRELDRKKYASLMRLIVQEKNM